VLGHYEPEALKTAITHLLASQVMVKVQTDENRRVPGRNYVFSDK
jgi:hypothetical protein